MPLTQVSPGLLDTQANAQGFRNRIINGDCRVDQRNAGASVSGTSGVYTVDRWKVQNNSGSARFNVQRNAGGVTPPVGFTNYLGITSTGAYSVASTDVIGIQQLVEGFNTADFGWGASGAATITLSFWVRSSLTGTFGGAILEGNAATASYPFSYTISAANTWEQKTVTVAGPTIGTWQTGSSTSIQLLFSMGTGSTYLGTAGSWSASSFYGATGQTNMVGTNGATFYITGVQLEKGTAATDFERLDYGRQLMQCQRYFCKTMDQNTVPANGLSGGANGYIYITPNATNAKVAATWKYPVTMRAAPTITTYGYAGATSNTWRNIDNSNNGPTITAFNTGQEMVGLYGDGTVTAWTAGQGYIGAATASAEL